MVRNSIENDPINFFFCQSLSKDMVTSLKSIFEMHDKFRCKSYLESYQWIAIDIFSPWYLQQRKFAVSSCMGSSHEKTFPSNLMMINKSSIMWSIHKHWHKMRPGNTLGKMLWMNISLHPTLQGKNMFIIQK